MGQSPGKLTNFPNGVASYGHPLIPLVKAWGGGPVYWVGNRTGLPAGDGSTPIYPSSSIFGTGGALGKVNGKVGATIYVLPGHVETVAASTNMSTVAGAATSTGINIIGLGEGAQRGLINWSAAASAVLVNLAGTWFRNLQFNFSSTAATVVTAAMTVSAADCGLDNVDILPATSATQLTTTGITIATGATNYAHLSTRVTSATFATNPTDIMTTTAAVDKLTMIGCRWLTAVNTTTNGVVNLANAPTNVYIDDCAFTNLKAASTVALIASASTSGWVRYTDLQIVSTGGATALSTPGNLTMDQVFGGQVGTRGIAVGTAST